MSIGKPVWFRIDPKLYLRIENILPRLVLPNIGSFARQALYFYVEKLERESVIIEKEIVAANHLER